MTEKVGGHRVQSGGGGTSRGRRQMCCEEEGHGYRAMDGLAVGLRVKGVEVRLGGW